MSLPVSAVPSTVDIAGRSRDDEIENLLGPDPLRLPPTDADFVVSLSATEYMPCVRPAAWIWLRLIELGRVCGRTIARHQQKGLPAPVSTFLALVPAVRSLLLMSLRARNLAISRDHEEDPEVRAYQLDTLNSTIRQNLQSCPANIAVLSIVLAGHVADWHRLQAEAKLTDLDVNAQRVREGEQKTMKRLQGVMASTLVDALLFILNAIEQQAGDGPTELVAHLSCLSAVQFMLPRWSAVALDIPCAERGGKLRPMSFEGGRRLTQEEAGPETYPWKVKKRVTERDLHFTSS